MIYKALQKIHVSDAGYLFYCENVMTGNTNIFPLTRSRAEGYNPVEDAQRWRDGMLVQRAFPYLDEVERELLLTGMTQEDWNNFSEEV
ncbi:MAG: hypothetical protein VW683_17475 [Betaproteobacteria bacterium]|jgi:hypothetical protein